MSQTRQVFVFFLGRVGKLICVGVFVSVSVREHVCVCVFYFGSCIPMARCRRRQPTARNQCIDAISTHCHLHPKDLCKIYKNTQCTRKIRPPNILGHMLASNKHTPASYLAFASREATVINPFAVNLVVSVLQDINVFCSSLVNGKGGEKEKKSK